VSVSDLAVDCVITPVLISYFMIMKYQKKVVLGLCASWVSVCSLFAVVSDGMGVFKPSVHELDPGNFWAIHGDDDDGQVLVNGINEINVDQWIQDHGTFLVGMGLTPPEVNRAEEAMRLDYEQGVPLEDLGMRAFFIMRGFTGEAVTAAVDRTRALRAEEGMALYEAPWRAWFELIGLDEQVALTAYNHVCFLSGQGMPLNVAYAYGMFAAYGYPGDVVNALVNTFWGYVGAQRSVQESFWYTLHQCAGVPADSLDWAWERQQYWVRKGYTLNQAFRVAIFETEGLPPGAAVQAYEYENDYFRSELGAHHAHWIAFYRVFQVPLNRLDEAYQLHQSFELAEGFSNIEWRALRVIAWIYSINPESLLNAVEWRQNHAKHPMSFFETLFRHIMYRLSETSHVVAQRFVDHFCKDAWDTNMFLTTTKRR